MKIDVYDLDIYERDNPNLAITFQRSVLAVGELYGRKMIDMKEFLRTVYQFGHLV
jgi:hypothetical protein